MIMKVTTRHRNIVIFQHDILCLSYEWLEQKYLVDRRKLKDVHDGALTCDEFTLSSIDEMGSSVPEDMPEESRQLVYEKQIRPKVKYWHNICGGSFELISRYTGFTKQTVRNIYTGESKTCHVDTIDKIIRMPKEFKFGKLQERFDSTDFIDDVDRWVNSGIPYTTIMFYCEGLKSGPLQNRHVYSSISKETYDAWNKGRDKLNSIADNVSAKDIEKQEALRADGVVRDYRVCPICGKKFIRVSRNNQKYCSKLCYRKAQNDQKRARDHEKKLKYHKICPVCSTEFDTTYSYKKYCSKICANRAKSLRRNNL